MKAWGIDVQYSLKPCTRSSHLLSYPALPCSLLLYVTVRPDSAFALVGITISHNCSRISGDALIGPDVLRVICQRQFCRRKAIPMVAAKMLAPASNICFRKHQITEGRRRYAPHGSKTLAPLMMVPHKLHIIRLSRLNKHERCCHLGCGEASVKILQHQPRQIDKSGFSRSKIKKPSPPHRRPPLLFRLGSAI